MLKIYWIYYFGDFRSKAAYTSWPSLNLLTLFCISLLTGIVNPKLFH